MQGPSYKSIASVSHNSKLIPSSLRRNAERKVDTTGENLMMGEVQTLEC